MSITIKKDAWRIKDDNGVYRSADLFSTMLPSEAQQLVEETQAEFTGMQNQLTSLAATKKQEISDEGLAQVTAVNTKGDEVLASIPNDYTITTHAIDAILHGGFIYSEKDKNSIVNFDDGADGMLIKSLVADIEPVQDLHGYDKPWPGGTINRIDATAVDDSNLYINANTGSQVVPGSGVWRKTDYIAVKPGETLYIGQINASATDPGLAFYDSSKKYKSGVNASTLSSNNNVVTVPQNVAYMRHSFRIDEGYNTDWETTVYIVDNADTHEWVPYENRCPIVERTELNGVRTGKNLFDESNATWVPGKLINAQGAEVNNTSYKYLSDYLRIYGATNLTFSFNKVSDGALTVPFYDKNKKFLERKIAISSSSGVTGRVHGAIEVPSNAYYCRFSCPAGSENTNYQIENGIMDGIYAEYTGSDISAVWQSVVVDPVYYGTIDVVSGVLKATYGAIDLGTLNYTYNSTHNGYYTAAMPSDAIAPRAQDPGHGVCSCYQLIRPSSYSEFFNSTNSICCYCVKSLSSNKFLFLKDSRYTDGKNLKAALAGQILVYELEEPKTYQLTPQQITCLPGVNNIWVDTGDVTVTYPVDTKTYIDRKIQEAIDGLSES